ncbi:MAG: MmgE/PrpD family protein [Alphaproteobacteria bacterium]|nr:MmgE/PrpD family protein [Alphaproteobacteria bacterium]
MDEGSATERLARWVAGFDAGAAGKGARERLKLSVLDAIGCAVLGRASGITAPVTAAQADLGAKGPATIIGGADPASVTAAVLINGTLIRALDFNDHQAIDPNDGTRLGGHPSDVLAVALAVGEWQGRSGAEVLEAALMGYEIFGRAQKLLGRDHSWDHVTVHGLTAPAIAGRLMGLSEAAIADALSLGAAHATTPGAVRRGALSSAKFLAGPMVLAAGVTATMLAAHGASGPRTVFEDRLKGLGQAVYTKGDPAALAAPMASRPMIEGVTIKAYPGLDTSQAPITAVIEAQAAHGGAVEDIAGVTLILTEHPMVRRQIEDVELKQPTNRETADHSLYYLAAAALVDSDVNEAQYAREFWRDARVKDLMKRITLETDAAWEKRAPGAFPCTARIATGSGAVFESSVAYAPGHARNPYAGEEVIAKFRRAVDGRIEARRADDIIAAVAEIDAAPTIAEVMKTVAG